MNYITVPARCRAVYACLCGHIEPPAYVRRTGKWRNIDIIQATGRNSADVRLRELVRDFPGQVLSEPIPGSKCGAKRFWLAGSLPEIRRPQIITQGTPALFDY